MPDGKTVTVPMELCVSPTEILFTRIEDNVFKEHPLHMAVWNTLQAVDVTLRSALLKNIIVCGGNTMFEGVPDRLHAELIKQAPAGS